MGSMHPSDYALVALAFFYSLNLGPMMFETFTSDRTWASDPPDSFYMFRGPYGQKTAHYWRIITPLAGAAFVLSLVLNWSAVDRRPWLFAFFVGYLAVQIPTMAYFVPEQEELISDSGALGREALKARADRWIFLSYFRNVVGVMSYVFLLFALLTPSTGAWQGAPPQ